jgi:hypothetical protein
MATTYSLSTDIGKCRLLASDTNVHNAIWDDDEWQAFLDFEGQSVLLAAALGLDTMAGDAAKVAIVTKNDAIGTDPSKVPGLLQAAAAALRTRASASSGSTAVVVTDPVFVPSRTPTGQSDADTLASTGGNQNPW